jgi:hypothetical protein
MTRTLDPLHYYVAQNREILVLLRTPADPKRFPKCKEKTNSKDKKLHCGSAQICNKNGLCSDRPEFPCTKSHQCRAGTECIVGECKPTCTDKACPEIEVELTCGLTTQTKTMETGRRFVTFQSSQCLKKPDSVKLSIGDSDHKTVWIYEMTK